VALLFATSTAIRTINGAVGRRGGAFDRLLKTIESIAAKKPVTDSPDPDPPAVAEGPSNRKAQKKTAGTGASPKRKSNKREQE
jgi:hypothetical protein